MAAPVINLGRGALTSCEQERVVATAPAAGGFAGSNRGDRQHSPNVSGQGVVREWPVSGRRLVRHDTANRVRHRERGAAALQTARRM
jgi:hypothetical protein